MVAPGFVVGLPRGGRGDRGATRGPTNPGIPASPAKASACRRLPTTASGGARRRVGEQAVVRRSSGVSTGR